MNIDGAVSYSEAELDHMAHDFLRRRVDVQASVPVNVETLLEQFSETIDLDTATGILSKHGVEGCVCKFKGSKNLTVFVDKTIADGSSLSRYNAVIAEELAHIKLHLSLVYQVQSIPDFIAIQRHAKWRELERDAKIFSTFIRVPTQPLFSISQEVYRDVVDEYGYGDVVEIQKLFRNKLANRFAVSSEDMDSRLAKRNVNIYRRVAASIQVASSTLLSAISAENVSEVRVQSMLFDDY